MVNEKRFIAVIGGGQCSKKEARMAEEVGKEIARRGAIRQAANSYVQIPIVTGIGYARNVTVVKSSQAVIAVGGSYGTLSEISYALQSGIPVIGLNTWSLSKNKRQDNSIIPAHSPTEAVDKALDLMVY